jgi:hypothetical protein
MSSSSMAVPSSSNIPLSYTCSYIEIKLIPCSGPIFHPSRQPTSHRRAGVKGGRKAGVANP